MQRIKFSFCTFVVIAVTAIFCGCAVRTGSYYDNSVAAEFKPDTFEKTSKKENLTPVIFIHGLFGSELWDDKKHQQLWGSFSYGTMLGNDFSRKLALPVSKNQSAEKIVPGKILSRSRVSVAGIGGKIDNYINILNMLDALGYRERDNTLFVFAYDWRRSIAENAGALALFVQEKRDLLKSLNRQAGDNTQEVRFDLIGHSMGGLIARYYVQYGNAPLGNKKSKLPTLSWAGAANVRKVIMVASPNGGYADTLVEISNDLVLARFAPAIPGYVLATFPSYYQMLPDVEQQNVKLAGSGKPVDIFDIAVWKKYRWGLLADDGATQDFLAEIMPAYTEKQRHEAVLDYTQRCLDEASRFKLLMNRPAGLPPEPVQFYSVASSGIPACSNLTVDPESGKVCPAGTSAGDGKIALLSAHPGHNGQSPVFLHGVITLDGGHMGVMRSDLFARNLVHLLQCAD